jgi:hypothetical protein
LTAEPLPPFAQDILHGQAEQTAYFSDVLDNPARANPAIFRGYSLPDYSWWWQIFFYRYLDMNERAGDRLNYRGRIANARAVVLPSTYVIYVSPGNADSMAGDGNR